MRRVPHLAHSGGDHETYCLYSRPPHRLMTVPFTRWDAEEGSVGHSKDFEVKSFYGQCFWCFLSHSGALLYLVKPKNDSSV